MREKFVRVATISRVSSKPCVYQNHVSYFAERMVTTRFILELRSIGKMEKDGIDGFILQLEKKFQKLKRRIKRHGVHYLRRLSMSKSAFTNILSMSKSTFRVCLSDNLKPPYMAEACSYMVILLRHQEISTLGHQS